MVQRWKSPLVWTSGLVYQSNSPPVYNSCKNFQLDLNTEHPTIEASINSTIIDQVTIKSGGFALDFIQLVSASVYFE